MLTAQETKFCSTINKRKVEHSAIASYSSWGENWVKMCHTDCPQIHGFEYGKEWHYFQNQGVQRCVSQPHGGVNIPTVSQDLKGEAFPWGTNWWEDRPDPSYGKSQDCPGSGHTKDHLAKLFCWLKMIHVKRSLISRRMISAPRLPFAMLVNCILPCTLWHWKFSPMCFSSERNWTVTAACQWITDQSHVTNCSWKPSLIYLILTACLW